MTSLIERAVAIIAPHYCIGCGCEDNILCAACRVSEHISLLSTCVMCSLPSSDWRLCRGCQRASNLQSVWVGGSYDGMLASVIKKFKFERTQAAYEPLGKIMLDVLPYGDWCAVAIPTAPQRIRQRGYDQAGLLAKYIAAKRGLVFSPALSRIQNTRQVGMNRMQRQKQSIKIFSMARGANVRGAHILLVDDVCTTGATLSAAASVLRKAGAAQIDAVVAAWQPPR